MYFLAFFRHPLITGNLPGISESTLYSILGVRLFLVQCLCRNHKDKLTDLDISLFLDDSMRTIFPVDWIKNHVPNSQHVSNKDTHEERHSVEQPKPSWEHSSELVYSKSYVDIHTASLQGMDLHNFLSLWPFPFAKSPTPLLPLIHTGK